MDNVREYEKRCEKLAVDLLEGPMCRKNWGANVRDAIKDRVQTFVEAEVERILKADRRALGRGRGFPQHG